MHPSDWRLASPIVFGLGHGRYVALIDAGDEPPKRSTILRDKKLRLRHYRHEAAVRRAVRIGGGDRPECAETAI